MRIDEVVGYTKDGEVYCSLDCLPGVYSDGPIFAGDEWELAPTCGACGYVIEDVNLIDWSHS